MIIDRFAFARTKNLWLQYGYRLPDNPSMGQFLRFVERRATNSTRRQDRGRYQMVARFVSVVLKEMAAVAESMPVSDFVAYVETFCTFSTQMEAKWWFDGHVLMSRKCPRDLRVSSLAEFMSKCDNPAVQEFVEAVLAGLSPEKRVLWSKSMAHFLGNLGCVIDVIRQHERGDHLLERVVECPLCPNGAINDQ